MKARSSYLDAARSAWREGLPDYVEALALKLDGGTTLRELAERIGYSKKTLLGVLDATYGRPRGDLARVEQAIRGALLGLSVRCPVLLGNISRADCLRHQSRPIAECRTSSQLVGLYRGCRSGCPHSELEPYPHVQRRPGATTQPRRGPGRPRTAEKRNTR